MRQEFGADGCSQFETGQTAVSPGDVFTWFTREVDPPNEKHRLSLSWDRDFVMISTPIGKDAWPDFPIQERHITCLPANVAGYSYVSCNNIVTIETGEAFAKLKPRYRGSVQTEVIMKLLVHVIALPTTEAELKERFEAVYQMLKWNIR